MPEQPPDPAAGPETAPQPTWPRGGQASSSPWPCQARSARAEHPRAQPSESHASLREPQQVTGNEGQKRSRRNGNRASSQEGVSRLSRRVDPGSGHVEGGAWGAGREAEDKGGGPRSARVLDRGGCVSRPHTAEGKLAGGDREGHEGASDPPGSPPGAWGPLPSPPPQGSSGQAPRLQKSPPCVWPPSQAAASNGLLPTDPTPEGAAGLPYTPTWGRSRRRGSPSLPPAPRLGLHAAEPAPAVGTESVCHPCCRQSPTQVGSSHAPQEGAVP